MRNDVVDAFADQTPFVIRRRISFLALSAAGRYTSAEDEHRRPGLIINVISRGSVLSRGEKEREVMQGEEGRAGGGEGGEVGGGETGRRLSSDKAIKREGIKRDKGVGVRATTSPGRHKKGTAPSPLNFRKAQEYSSAAERRICVTPRKEIELVCSPKE